MKIYQDIKRKREYLFIGCLVLLVISYSIVFVTSPDKADKITKEDGFIETLSFIFYFFSAVFTGILYITAKNNKRYILRRNRNIFLLLLALFFFFCAGEEISWGQRILGIGTPERLEEVNAQKELNLHNFWFFQSYDKNYNDKNGFQKMFTSARIFAYIWFLYCVLIPILNKYSLKLHDIFRQFYLPVIPIWLGILFLTNHIFSKIVAILLADNLLVLHEPITEIKETNFAFLFFIASLSLFYSYKQSYPEISKKSHS